MNVRATVAFPLLIAETDVLNPVIKNDSVERCAGAASGPLGGRTQVGRVSRAAEEGILHST
jgi:hypothetical protein